MTEGRRAWFLDRAWLAFPQAVSRISSVVIFALLAHRASSEQLGAFVIASAISSASTALAPAVIGKPLASLAGEGALHEEAEKAQSAALLASFAAAVLLLAFALPTSGVVRLTLMMSALGVPAAMIVESTFWRDAFTRGGRSAGGLLAAAYAVQTVGSAVAVLAIDSPLIVFSPSATLLLFGIPVLLTKRSYSLHGAVVWLRYERPRWLPYVLGVASNVILVQAIPLVITATVGLEYASVYRAGELAFGGTNLLIGMATQTLLARSTTKPRAAYSWFSVLLGGAAIINGLLVWFLPGRVVQTIFGRVAPLLHDFLPIITVQRAALAIASIGAILLVPLLTARWVGLLDAIAASTAVSFLVAGSILGGLGGSLVALAAAQVALSLMYYRILIRRI